MDSSPALANTEMACSKHLSFSLHFKGEGQESGSKSSQWDVKGARFQLP